METKRKTDKCTHKQAKQADLLQSCAYEMPKQNKKHKT